MNLDELQANLNRTEVVSPTGEYGTVDNVALRDALSSGYRLPTGDEKAKKQEADIYGKGLGSLAAFGAAGARGLTFGLSDIALDKLGLYSKEDLDKFKEYNPGISTGAELGTIAGSVLLGAGLPSLLGKGATKIGAAAAARVTEKEIAKRIIANSIAGSLEGAVYTGGASISEEALGDSTLNAQKIFHNIGLGALLGGGIGGGLGLLSGGAKAGKSWLLGKFGRASDGPEVITAKPTVDVVEEAIEPVPGGQVRQPKAEPVGTTTEEHAEIAKALRPDLESPPTREVARFQQDKTKYLPVEKGGKIGTEEIPSFAEGPRVPGDKTVRGSEAFLDDLQKAREMSATMREEAETILGNSDATLKTSRLKRIFQDQRAVNKDTFSLGEQRAAADSLMDKYVKKIIAQEKKLGRREVTAPEIKKNLQELWDDIKGGYELGKDVSPSIKALKNVAAEINKDLKGKVGQQYSDLMDRYSHYVETMNATDKLLGVARDPETGVAVPKIMNWFQNRVVTPLQRVVMDGEASSLQAKTLKEFSKLVGRDWSQAVDSNLTYGRLFPDAAIGGQRGSFSSALFKALIRNMTHPVEAAKKGLGKVAEGAVDVVAGQPVELLQEINKRAAQDALLGTSGAMKRATGLAKLLKSAIEQGSDLFKPPGALRSLMVPESVMAMKLLDQYDSMDEAERNLESLIALERAKNDADKKIHRAVKGIFKDEEPVGPDKTVEKLFEKSDKHADEWESISADLNELVNNPEKFLNDLTEQVSGLENVAPNTAMALNMTASRAVNLLRDRLQLPELGPLDSKYIPSRDQIVSFAKYMRAINKPFDVLSEIRDGNISRESREIMQGVYPELYQHLSGEILSEVASSKASKRQIPLQKRIGLATFLGQDLDRSMNATAIIRNQAALGAIAGKSPQMAAAPKPRASGAKHLDMAGRSMTPLQQSANRRNA